MKRAAAIAAVVAATMAALVSAQAISAATSARRYYASDEHGIAYGLIPAFRMDEYEWVLSVERPTAATEIRILFRKGVERERRIYELSPKGFATRETVLVGGMPKESRRYGSGGELLEETRFGEKGTAEETRIYSYDKSLRLVSISCVDGLGSTLWSDRYSYARDGRLTEIRRTWPDGRITLTGTTGSTPSEEWMLTGGSGTYSVFGSRGELLSREEYSNGKLVASERREYGESGAAPSLRKKTVVDSLANSTTVTEYDERGLPSVETVTIGETAVSETRWEYDAFSRPYSVVSTERDRVVMLTFEYDTGPFAVIERYYENGILTSAVFRSTDADSWYEELYWEGTAFVRVYYEKGRKVKEEMLVDGEVARTRYFQ